MTLAESFCLLILSALITVGALGGIACLRATGSSDKLHPGE